MKTYMGYLVSTFCEICFEKSIVLCLREKQGVIVNSLKRKDTLLVLKTQLGTACGPPTSNCTAFYVEANTVFVVQIGNRFICYMR